MSGPKTSHYTLTLEQRRILQEQRKVSMEQNILKKQLKDSRDIIDGSNQIIEQIERLYSEIGKESDIFNQTKTVFQNISNMFMQDSMALANNSGDFEYWRTMNKNFRTSKQKLEAILKVAKAEYDKAYQSFCNEIVQQIDVGFNFLFDMSEDSEAEDPIIENIQMQLDELVQYTLPKDQQSRIAKILAQAKEIKDKDFLKNYYSMTVVPFVKECQVLQSAYKEQEEEYERKCFIYEMNAQKLGNKVEQIPFSLNAIAQLDEKIKETEEAIQHREEQAYISKCVDEAMREMGYTIAGNREVVRHNGQRFQNELYLFDEGTAVNVTYSNNGQITMELGGIGMEDRFPTPSESESLVVDMQAFCDDYYEIEEKLKKKGIISHRISILPPESQYAQIINVNDYNIDTEVIQYEVKNTKKKFEKQILRKMSD